MDGDDDLFAMAERQEFGYYLTVAYMSADPNDWSTFRRAIHGALVGSYLDRNLADDVSADEAPDQQQAMRLLDEIRASYDPAVTWAGFVLAVWSRRHEFRAAPEQADEGRLPSDPTGLQALHPLSEAHPPGRGRSPLPGLWQLGLHVGVRRRHRRRPGNWQAAATSRWRVRHP